MRAAWQKPHHSRTVGSPDRGVAVTAASLGREAHPGFDPRASAPRLARDFSGIPVHGPVGRVIQAKPEADTSGDPFEREADAVAGRVLNAVAPLPPPLGLHSAEGARVYPPAPGVAELSAGPPIVHEVVSAPGWPLDAATRAWMEARFGHDFSSVRVHTDARAAASARALDALAYSVGRDVVFGAGQYDPSSSAGRRLMAHELAHVIQQGFAARGIQRQKAKPKKATASFKSIFELIKQRDPDLAALITPQSIETGAKPPDIKGGPLKDKEEHHWQVRVLSSQGFAGSRTVAGGEQRKKMKGGTRVTHFIDITWALPLAPSAEFLKQAGSEGEALGLTAAESLYHELIHARLMMEGDPHWTLQHSKVFQGFTDILQAAASPAVDKERQDVKTAIRVLAKGGGTATTDDELTKAEDRYYEFLVHEKYDADVESKAFGRTYPNSLVAERYAEVVARRLGADEDTIKIVAKPLATAAEKLFDKLDQAAQAAQAAPAAPSSQAP